MFPVANRSYDVREELKKWLVGSDRIVVAGIGNPIRTDDFVGVKIVQGLQGKVSEKVCLIECETVPESFMQEIVDFKPSHVLLIDAAVLELEPGETRLIFPEQVTEFPTITTHVLPLTVFCEYIAKMTDAKIALLLIVPKSTEFGEGLTLSVETVAEKITGILLELFGA